MKKVIFLSLAFVVILCSQVEAQKAIPFTHVVKVGGKTYIETEKIVQGSPYKTFWDNTYFADSLLKKVSATVEGAETSFGLTPGEVVNELHFVKCEDRGFFNAAHSSGLFFSTILDPKPDFVEKYQALISIGLEETARHEFFHLADTHFGLTKDSAIAEFMEKLDSINTKKIFDFVYIELSPYYCFMDQEAGRKKIGLSHSVEYKTTERELFAQVFATLNTECWEKKVKELKVSYPDTFREYRYVLELLCFSIEGKIHGNPPVKKLIKHRICQMRKLK